PVPADPRGEPGRLLRLEQAPGRAGGRRPEDDETGGGRSEVDDGYLSEAVRRRDHGRTDACGDLNVLVKLVLGLDRSDGGTDRVASEPLGASVRLDLNAYSGSEPSISALQGDDAGPRSSVRGTAPGRRVRSRRDADQ